MKKTVIGFFVFISLFIFTACAHQVNMERNNDTVEKMIAVTLAKSNGAKDAFFNKDNYLIYCTDFSKCSSSGNALAHSMLPIISKVKDAKGCIVVDYNTHVVFGEYTMK